MFANQAFGTKYVKQFTIAAAAQDNDTLAGALCLAAPGANKRWVLHPVLASLDLPADRAIGFSVQFLSATSGATPSVMTAVSSRMGVPGSTTIVRSTQAPLVVGEVNAPVYALFRLDDVVPTSGTGYCGVEFHAHKVDESVIP